MPLGIKIVKLVFCESFNWRHKNYSDRFLLEERGDRSLALLGVSKILRSQLVTKRRYRYLRKTHQWPVSTKCRLQTGYKMQNRYKMQTADCVQNADWGFKLFFFFFFIRKVITCHIMAGRLFLNLFLFQDFCLEIGMSENRSSTGYALHFEYMYICYNYKYYPKHFWTIR